MAETTFESVYRAKAVRLSQGALTCFVPQVFGDVEIEVTDFLTPPRTGMGWVMFQAGDPAYPVWLSQEDFAPYVRRAGDTIGALTVTGALTANGTITANGAVTTSGAINAGGAVTLGASSAANHAATRSFVSSSVLDSANNIMTFVDSLAGTIPAVSTHAPTFISGFGHYGSPYTNVKLTRIGPLVLLEGLLRRTGGTAFTSGQMATITVASFRPATIVFAGNLSSNGLCRVEVSTAGAISLNAVPAVSLAASSGWVSLNLSWTV